MSAKKRVGLARFNSIRLKNDYLITNESGEWLFLEDKDYKAFLSGKLNMKSALYARLEAKGFVDVSAKKKLDMAVKYLKLNRSLSQGPSLFILVLTLRCNHRCLYCQITPERSDSKGFDMTKATAKKSLDLIFKTPSESISLEFQGGEPILNWPVLKFIVEYAHRLNKQKKKDLKINLVSNLTLLDEAKLRFLLDAGVNISCSFDGPANVHNKNRIYIDKGNSHRHVIEKIKFVQKAIAAKKKNSTGKLDDLNGILTVSRFSLPYPEEIIDEYMRRGFDNVFLRPLSPFGLERQAWKVISYKAEDFIGYYKRSMDYILKINLGGKLFIERGTYLILKKILQGVDPNFLELRSPCGAGIGQMAFNYDGRVYTCDEGRMAARMGYDNFELGHVGKDKYNDLVDNEVNKTMCLASSLDNHAGCQSCAYKPYCGICPLANFVAYGTIFPQLSNTDRCKINKAMFGYIFEKLQNKKYRAIFERWVGLQYEQ